MTQDKNLLGEFHFNGIPRVVFQIGVTPAIDANGILNASAQGKSAGKSNQITISTGRDVCLRTQCECAKRTLSSCAWATIVIDGIHLSLSRRKHGMRS